METYNGWLITCYPKDDNWFAYVISDGNLRAWGTTYEKAIDALKRIIDLWAPKEVNRLV